MRDIRIFSFTLCDSGGCVNVKKPQGQAAQEEENNIYMQQQQVSTLQIRALGALCRLLSQVWRGRIALAIPRLHKVWTKYAANLFCAELEGKKNITGICFGLPTSVSHLVSCLPWFFFPLFYQRFNCLRLIITNVLGGISEHVCSGSNGCFNWTASDINSTTKRQTQHQKETHPIQRAQSNHKDKERVWALAQEWLILGELARPTASKCITYGVPFSQLPQREHKKCYISLSKTNKQPPRYAESV